MILYFIVPFYTFNNTGDFFEKNKVLIKEIDLIYSYNNDLKINKFVHISTIFCACPVFNHDIKNFFALDNFMICNILYPAARHYKMPTKAKIAKIPTKILTSAKNFKKYYAVIYVLQELL